LLFLAYVILGGGDGGGGVAAHAVVLLILCFTLDFIFVKLVAYSKV